MKKYSLKNKLLFKLKKPKTWIIIICDGICNKYKEYVKSPLNWKKIFNLLFFIDCREDNNKIIAGKRINIFKLPIKEITINIIDNKIK